MKFLDTWVSCLTSVVNTLISYSSICLSLTYLPCVLTSGGAFKGGGFVAFVSTQFELQSTIAHSSVIPLPSNALDQQYITRLSLFLYCICAIVLYVLYSRKNITLTCLAESGTSCLSNYLNITIPKSDQTIFFLSCRFLDIVCQVPSLPKEAPSSMAYIKQG